MKSPRAGRNGGEQTPLQRVCQYAARFRAAQPKIETLIMTGVSTNVCVESTARDGFMLDYHIVLLSDACASYSKKAHEMTMENIRGYFGDVAESGSVIALWERERKAPEMLLKVAKQR